MVKGVGRGPKGGIGSRDSVTDTTSEGSTREIEVGDGE